MEHESRTDGEATGDYDAVVYDLDGTLVHLAVDWERVAAEAEELFADAGIDAAGRGLWEMFDLADEHGLRAELESHVATHEEDGARRSERLSVADELDGAVPVGVCSLNCESACRIALAMHELDGDVSAVVGRDSVGTRKPDPEPLLAVLRELGVAPERALFVGDSLTDEEAAERAGVDFRYVKGGPVDR